MTITINGNGTVTGISVGGLPDGIVDQDMLASGVPAITTTSGTNNFTVADGDLVIGTSGHGISFAADGNLGGMSNELFDDYEEGTWTPTMNGGYTSITYSDQQGGYVKVGNLVTCWYRIGISSATANSNAFSVGPLPFTTKNWNGGAETPMGGNTVHVNFAEFTGGDWFTPAITDGDVNMSFNKNGGTTLATTTNVSSNKFVQGWAHFAT